VAAKPRFNASQLGRKALQPQRVLSQSVAERDEAPPSDA
jgi:hypothetical protein